MKTGLFSELYSRYSNTVDNGTPDGDNDFDDNNDDDNNNHDSDDNNDDK